MVITIAQYLTCFFILAPEKEYVAILKDVVLFKLICANILSIAAGYIINNFFDAEKDQINKPNRFMITNLISQKTQLILYIIFNSIALLFAYLVSLKAIFFFGGYMFTIFFYSYYIKRFYWVSNLINAILVITPFFAITLYYKTISFLIINFALYLFMLVLVRSFIKDLMNFKGDWVLKYRTFPIVFGEKNTKGVISVLMPIFAIPIIRLQSYSIHAMKFYFICSIPILLFLIIKIWKANSQKHYVQCNNIVKFLIILGILSIALINF